MKGVRPVSRFIYIFIFACDCLVIPALFVEEIVIHCVTFVPWSNPVFLPG